MAERKEPFNIGIIFNDKTLYTSDMSIKPVIELARFSISFANNLVRHAKLRSITHEPIVDSAYPDSWDSKEYHVIREHILFKNIKNKFGEELTFCITFPSIDDLKSMELSRGLTTTELKFLAESVLDAFINEFKDVTGFGVSPLSKMDQFQTLEFHRKMMDLFEQMTHALDIILVDQDPDIGIFEKRSSSKCEFLFVSVMHGSVPCCSRFFTDMADFFKITYDEEKSDVSFVLENLLSAQLSTIISTSISLANTTIRQIEILYQEENTEDTIYLTFHTIKNNYILALISKGNPRILQFFTRSTASTLSESPVLNRQFTGDLSPFDSIKDFLNTIPPFIEAKQETNLEEIVDDLDLELVIVDKGGKKQKRNPKPSKSELKELDKAEKDFYKHRDNLIKLQEDINRAIFNDKIKVAFKKVNSIIELAEKINAPIIKRYYDMKKTILESLLNNT
ncbi:MAG: hypothetical protein ACTSXP_05050 [Promethearchaeota archaeon]